MAKFDSEGMFHPYENSWDTVRGILDYGEGVYFGKMSPKVLSIILEELNKPAQVVINRILQLLNSDTQDESTCKSLIGHQGYKYTIECTQEKLAKILNLKQPYLAKGLKELKEHKLIIQKRGVIFINPLLYNKNELYSLAVIKEFGLFVKPFDINNNYKNKSTGNVTRKKVDKNNIRYDIGM